MDSWYRGLTFLTIEMVCDNNLKVIKYAEVLDAESEVYVYYETFCIRKGCSIWDIKKVYKIDKMSVRAAKFWIKKGNIAFSKFLKNNSYSHKVFSEDDG